MAVRIDTPTGEQALLDFLTFHDQVYAARAARWTAPVLFQMPVLLGQGPFAADREVCPFIALENEQTVARVLAIVDRRYQRHWNESLGHLVMFEAVPESRAAVRDLMNTACAWLEARGATAARAGFGLFEFAFAIDAYETLPPAFLRQNPVYYHALLKDAGFETEQGLVDYRITVRPELLTRWEGALAGAERQGFQLKTLATLSPERRVGDFTTLWNEAFASHFGYVPFSVDEVRAIQDILAPVGMLDLSLIAYRGDEPQGVLWAMPDTSFMAPLASGYQLRNIERVNFLGLGVRTVARGQGLNLAMPAHAYLELARRGATHLSYTLVLDDNWPSRRTAEKLGAEVCANYLVYRRELRR